MNPSPIRHILSGKAVAIRGNDIDTDRVIPARFLKEITFNNMGNYLFYDERFNQDGTQKDHPINDPKFSQASIMIVGNNFGCGSSREHAPQAIMRHGITAIIGESFSEIFKGNCKAIGVPTLTTSKETIDQLQTQVETEPNTQFQINIETKTIEFNNPDSSTQHSVQVDCPDSDQKAYLKGEWDVLTILKKNQNKITQTEKNLPYF